MTTRTFNGRPTYIGQNNYSGIWWSEHDGGDWLIGPYLRITWITDSYGETVGEAWLKSDQDTSCPTHSEHWTEHVLRKDHYEWDQLSNVNAQVYCEGTYQ